MNNRAKRLTYWSELNKQWELSGLPQQRFCEQQGVVYKQFVYWRKQVLKHNEPEPKLLKVALPEEPIMKLASEQPRVSLEVFWRVSIMT